MFYLIYIGTAILFINVMLYNKVKKGVKTPFLILKFYLLVMLLIQVSSILLSKFKIDNIFLSHFYFVFQFVLLSLFYSNLFEEKNKIRVVSLLILLIIGVQYIITPSVFFEFSLLEIVLTSIVLIIYSTMYFSKYLTRDSQYKYFNYGIFIYLLSSTLLFSSGNIIMDLDKSVNKIIWFVNSILFVFYQLLIFLEWYKNFRSTKESLKIE